MKTVAQTAVELGVSVQTIYRVLNRVKQETEECLTEKVNGVTHITRAGEDIVKERLTGVKQVLNNDEELLNSVKQAESAEIVYLREQNRVLLDELVAERTHSRGQADKLSDLAAQLAELSRNNQLLLGAEQSRTNPALMINNKPPQEEGERQQREGWFFRFFSRNRNIF